METIFANDKPYKTMKNIFLKRTNSNDPDFKLLVILLDNDLDKINGIIQLAYNQHNVIDFIETVLIAYVDGIPAGCGCFKKFNDDTVEIKRMFVKEDQRCQGIAGTLLTELEQWAKEKNYTHAVLETGKRHAEALHLYAKKGYTITENYEPYIGMEESVCMAKSL